MSTSTISVPYVEPWLRGTYADVPAVGRAVLHALDLALEDISKWTEGLTDSEAVSYTHLDVYKRQTRRCREEGVGNRV